MADLLDTGDFVQIDRGGFGHIAERLENGSYLVDISDIDYQAELSPRRLTKVMNETHEVEQTIAENETTVTRVTTNDVNQASSRFVTISEDDVSKTIQAQENKNTAMKTYCDIRLLKQFLKQPQINENREIYSIPPAELSPLLSKFFLSVRKPSGENYEPASLRSLMSSFDRYLKRNNYMFSLATGVEFFTLREALKSKQKELKKSGKGNLPRRAEPTSDEEIEKLWETGQFGSSSPGAIINTLWFYTTVNFGLRGATEHRNMCWGDVKLCTDSGGREYLEFRERQTKTRTGADPRDTRAIKPKMWDVPSNRDRCPVQVYKRFRDLRPVNYSNDDSPFYVATHTTQQHPEQGSIWFRRQPIGVNKISSLMKTMAISANLSDAKRLTNHSARKHLVQKLNDNNIPPNQIMQISGHKNIQSVNAYSSISENQHRNISAILNNVSELARPTSSMSAVQNSPTSSEAIPGPSFTQETSNLSQSVIKSTSHSVKASGITSMFGGHISGGVFNIHIHGHDASESHPKRRRIRVIESSQSDEDY